MGIRLPSFFTFTITLSRHARILAMRTTSALFVSLSVLFCGGTFAADAPTAKSADQPTTKAAARKRAPRKARSPLPTLADVHYGADPKQVLNFWKAESPTPTPLLFFIHGGGWQWGIETAWASCCRKCSSQASPSSPSSIGSSRRHTPRVRSRPWSGRCTTPRGALQFVRSKAAEWNIDKQRIGASGGSAGACSSLWLAFHRDMADPKSADPVARESTRLWCAAVTVAQTTLDPQQMKEWTPNSHYGGHAFGIFTKVNGKDVADFEQFLAQREKILPWIQEYSPYALVNAGAPPIFLFYPTPPALGKEQKDPTHTSNFGVKLQEKCKSVGIECELVYPGAPDVKHATVESYLIERLKAVK